MYKLENQSQENHDLSFMWAYRVLGIMFKKGIIYKKDNHSKTALKIRSAIEIAIFESKVKCHYVGFHHVEAALRAYGVEIEKADKLRYKSLKLKLKLRFDISEEIRELYKELGHNWDN